MSEEPSITNAARQLLSAGVSLSAEMARSLAEAASGRPQTQRVGEPPLQALVRHGSTAAGSLIALTTAAIQGASSAEVRQNPVSQNDTKAAPTIPSVSCGGVLKLPLSIDNPSAETFTDIAPHQIVVTREDDRPIAGVEVTFEPTSLSIAPRDFEKMSVRIAASEDAVPGRHTLRFTLGSDTESITIHFDVGLLFDDNGPGS